MALDHTIKDLSQTALTLASANAIAEGRVPYTLSARAQARCDAGHARLVQAIAERRHIYGVTTGFGPLANRLIDPAEGSQLQQNLVHHLATGLGACFDWATARAIVLARLHCIAQGYSGASRRSIQALTALLASDLAPAIPERGTVGASGDLTPLAHMVLALQGRGTFFDVSGASYSGPDGLARLEIDPLDLAARDGLALVNGTSAMTGIALRNARLGQSLLSWALRLSAALAEVMRAQGEAWSPVLADLRGHPGQVHVTQALNKALTGNARVQRTPIAARQLSADGFVTEDRIGQDAYTLRCVPQILGAVQDALAWHDQVVLTELNGVSDNPVFPPNDADRALHGGNFMGQHVALASDSLGTAITVLAGLVERQIARLTDERLNDGLPAFLHHGVAGLNSGLMGAQVTATATLAEIRSRGPASVHSISTNGANQDVVSMGTIAARRVTDIAHLTSDILAILSLAVAQAMDLTDASDKAEFSPAARALCKQIRALSAPLTEDRPLAQDIAALASLIRSTPPSDPDPQKENGGQT